MHRWTKAISAISRFFQDEEKDMPSLILKPMKLVMDVLAGFKGLRVRKLINKHGGLSNRKKNLRFYDLPNSSDMLRQQVHTATTVVLNQLGKSFFFCFLFTIFSYPFIVFCVK